MHKQVEQFNQEILKIEPREVGLMGEQEFRLSMQQLREEISEIEDAYAEGDLVGVLDGLIDLDYFQKGVVYKHGISAEVYKLLFGQVHHCNMTKKKGVKETRQGFGDSADAIKPTGWIAPETKIRDTLRAIRYESIEDTTPRHTISTPDGSGNGTD